jgi:hypothetical protein
MRGVISVVISVVISAGCYVDTTAVEALPPLPPTCDDPSDVAWVCDFQPVPLAGGGYGVAGKVACCPGTSPFAWACESGGCVTNGAGVGAPEQCAAFGDTPCAPVHPSCVPWACDNGAAPCCLPGQWACADGTCAIAADGTVGGPADCVAAGSKPCAEALP